MIVHNNNTNEFNEINWDADYDGNVANISLDSISDGNKKHFEIQLDNNDLANLLNIPSVNMPIDKRLKLNLKTPSFRHDPNIYKIELPNIKDNSYIVEEPDTIEELVTSLKQPQGYLSSPLPNEELIVPISINDKTLHNYSLTPRKRHKYKKTHKTYKVYKKNKSSKLKSSSKKQNTKTKYQRL